MDSQKIAEYWIELKYKVEQAGLRQAEKDVERLVNKRITANSKLEKSEKTLAKAVERSALSQGEKIKSASQLMNSHVQIYQYAKKTADVETRARKEEERFSRMRETERRRQEAHVSRISKLQSRTTTPPIRSPSMMGDVGRPGSLGVAWHTALAGGGILTGFGLRALNQKVQQLQMLPVMMETVTGSAERAQQELAFTKRLSSELGITQLDLTPDYTKLMAATLGTPMEGGTQQGFSNFLRYSKVMGLDQERTKLSLRALTQIANKGTLMSEEVKSQ